MSDPLPGPGEAIRLRRTFGWGIFFVTDSDETALAEVDPARVVTATGRTLSVAVRHEQDIEIGDELFLVTVDVHVGVAPPSPDTLTFQGSLDIPSGRLEIGDADETQQIHVRPGRWSVAIEARPADHAEHVDIWLLGPAAAPMWMTAFVDSPAADDAAAFWCAVTGGTLSPWRDEQFATVHPPSGTPYLRVQRFEHDRVHLDLHVDDLDAWSAAAVALGATILHRAGHVVLRSPGGFVFCLVPAPADAERPAPVTWNGHTSLLDQVTLDIPSAHWARETAFWADLTGWPVRPIASPEFDRLDVPSDQPWRILLQRLDDVDGDVRAHLDLAASDRTAEVARHVRLGATVLGEGRVWTVLRPPAGPVYCVTDRDPATGAIGS